MAVRAVAFEFVTMGEARAIHSGGNPGTLSRNTMG